MRKLSCDILKKQKQTSNIRKGENNCDCPTHAKTNPRWKTKQEYPEC